MGGSTVLIWLDVAEMQPEPPKSLADLVLAYILGLAHHAADIQSGMADVPGYDDEQCHGKLLMQDVSRSVVLGRYSHGLD